MENRGFSKAERLLRRPQFERVLNGGRRCRVGRLCTLFSLPNGLGRKRLGIIASRKVGNAIVRNRAKRMIRELFRQNKNRLQDGMDVVVISGKLLPRIPLSELEQKILPHLSGPA